VDPSAATGLSACLPTSEISFLVFMLSRGQITFIDQSVNQHNSVLIINYYPLGSTAGLAERFTNLSISDFPTLT
jgi:hypothetical protein